MKCIEKGVFTAFNNVVDRDVLQAMWEKLAGQVVRAINSLSANHAHLKTLYKYYSH